MLVLGGSGTPLKAEALGAALAVGVVLPAPELPVVSQAAKASRAAVAMSAVRKVHPHM